MFSNNKLIQIIFYNYIITQVVALENNQSSCKSGTQIFAHTILNVVLTTQNYQDSSFPSATRQH